MEKNNESDLDSFDQVSDEVIELEDNDDINVLTDKFQKLSEAHKKVSEANKQLFSRTKKAEGFELKEGKWVKPAKEEPKNDTLPSKELPKLNELDYGQLALLRTEGIKGSEELALFKEIMRETGKGVLDILDSQYFKSRLSELREVKATADAMPKAKNRTGYTGVTEVDLAVAKFKETGELPKDFTTRNKVVDIITKEEKGELFQSP